MNKYISLLFILLSCNQISENISKEKILSAIKNNDEFHVISTIPSGNDIFIQEKDKVQVLFNKKPNFDSCLKAFQIYPIVYGAYTEISMGMEFVPHTKWNPGTYSITLLKTCEDIEGTDLSKVFNFQIKVRYPDPIPEPEPPPPSIPPFVQAVGLESQNCSDIYPGKGSPTGGDWNLNSCFWDSELPLLPASQYKFRGGDTGNGSFGLSTSCDDKTSDNLKIIFSQYMDPASTVQGVKLKRISVPPSNILLASHNWKDCSPEGCRVLILRFSEMEASCNGTLFGGTQTGGDFNLQKTDNSISGTQQYTLSVDSITARTLTGISMKNIFYFSMEGN